MGAAPNCCGTPPAKPCDIERDPLPAALSFTPAFFAHSGDACLVVDQRATAVAWTDAFCKAAFDTAYQADRGRPPIYLAILTLLC